MDPLTELIYAGLLKTLEDEGKKVIKAGKHTISVFVPKTKSMRWITVVHIWASPFIQGVYVMVF